MTNNKTLIIVEGIADIIFLRDYLQFIYKDNKDFEKVPPKIFSPVKSDDKVFELQVYKTPNIKLFCTGGITKLEILSKYIEENYVANDYKLILVFDTDSVEKDPKTGGFIQRMAYIKTQIQKIETERNIKLVFEDIFLLPTNLSTTNVENARDGDVETILLDIKTEKYQQFMSCYEGFCKCAEVFSIHKMNEYRKNKTALYHYIQVYQGENKAKEKERVYTSEFWNFEHESLNNLKAFFEKNI
jgi:hypothetical protein